MNQGKYWVVLLPDPTLEGTNGDGVGRVNGPSESLDEALGLRKFIYGEGNETAKILREIA